MKTAENIININEAKTDLPHLLDELSFSYSITYSAQQSLDDLDKSIHELETLVKCLKERTDKAV